MIRLRHTVRNSFGIHYFTAAQIVLLAQEGKSMIIVEYNNEEINGASILQLVSSGIKQDAEIYFRITGEDEDEIYDKLKKILKIKNI